MSALDVYNDSRPDASSAWDSDYDLDERQAAAYATKGEEDSMAPGDYAPIRSANSISGAKFNRRGKNPLGTAYNRMRPNYEVYSNKHNVDRISNLSSQLASSARRMSSKDPEQNTVVDNRPAEFSPATFNCSVTHVDLPLNRSRVDTIFTRKATRGLAF